MKLPTQYRLLGTCDRPGRRTLADPKQDLQATACALQAGQFSGSRQCSRRRGPQKLSVQPVQHSIVHGRDKDRVRYPHRRRHQQQLRDGGGLAIGTLNMRGWNWAAQDPRHEEKHMNFFGFFAITSSTSFCSTTYITQTPEDGIHAILQWPWRSFSWWWAWRQPSA